MPNTYTDSMLTTPADLRQMGIDPLQAGSISGYLILDGGTGHGAGTTLTVSHPNPGVGVGVQATVTPVIVGGVIVDTIPGNAGQGYVSATCTVTGGGGSGAIIVPQFWIDGMLTDMIGAASSMILDAANITTFFDSGSDISETRNGNGRFELIASVTPIVSVTSISVSERWGMPRLIQAASIRFDKTKFYLHNDWFPKGEQNVFLAYRGGEAQDSLAQRSAKRACNTTIALWLKRKADIHLRQDTVSQLGAKTFITNVFSAEADEFIRNHKRWVPVV